MLRETLTPSALQFRHRLARGARDAPDAIAWTSRVPGLAAAVMACGRDASGPGRGGWEGRGSRYRWYSAFLGSFYAWRVPVGPKILRSPSGSSSPRLTPRRWTRCWRGPSSRAGPRASGAWRSSRRPCGTTPGPGLRVSPAGSGPRLGPPPSPQRLRTRRRRCPPRPCHHPGLRRWRPGRSRCRPGRSRPRRSGGDCGRHRIPSNRSRRRGSHGGRRGLSRRGLGNCGSRGSRRHRGNRSRGGRSRRRQGPSRCRRRLSRSGLTRSGLTRMGLTRLSSMRWTRRSVRIRRKRGIIRVAPAPRAGPFCGTEEPGHDQAAAGGQPG